MRIAAVTAALVVLVHAGGALAQQQPGKPAQPKAPPAKGAAPAQAEKNSLLTHAARGEPQAQMQLAEALRDGKGMAKDPAQALQWFMLAAVNGAPAAAQEAARAHEARRDPAAAARWWYLAGKQGDEAARARFLDLFLAGQAKGIGGPEGAAWLQDLAEKGDMKAQLALATVYETGDGVPADAFKAERWFREAAALGDAEARFRLGRLMLALPGRLDEPKEDGKPKDLVRPGLVEGERWLTLAAGQGHDGAQYELGRAMVEGIELPLDMVEGTSYLQAAAAQGHGEALALLAALSAKGQAFFVKDPVRAWVYYDLAASQGRKEAEAAREALAKTMKPRQIERARAISTECREVKGS